MVATETATPAPPRRTRGRHGRSSGPRLWPPTTRGPGAFPLATSAIWPEDIETLASQQADVLVTHEAPGSHPAGNARLDELARAMGVRTIVHGHHHIASYSRAHDGLKVFAVGPAWGASLDGTVLWEGDRLRPLPSPVDGWMVQSIAA